MTNEQYLVGAILIDDQTIPRISNKVTAEDFQSEHCRAIFVAAMDIAAEGGVVDPVSIMDRARRNGTELPRDFIKQLIEIVPTAEYGEDYARRVAEDARTRRIKELAQAIQDDLVSSPDELLERLQKDAAELSKGRPTGGNKPALIRACDVPYEPPRWTITPYIQRGKGTLIQGDNGTGKTVLACGFAAAVSSGTPILGIRIETPGDVIVLSVEDDMPILRGRIESSGGDMARCHFVTEAHQITLTSPELEELIKEVSAKLIILDPLQAFLGANIDMHMANQTRPVLAHLFQMCDRNDCACLIVGHNGKNVVNKAAVNMALGSVDIPASMRSIIHLITNPDDPEERLAIHIKCSNAPKGKTLAYGVDNMGGVEWHGFSDFTMEDLNALGNKKDKYIPTPYENEPLVQVFNQLITDRPAGGFWSYANLKEEGAKILGFPPFDSVGDLRKKLDAGLARELQKNDGLIVTHSQTGTGNVRGIRMQRYKIPEGYQTKIQGS